MTNPRRIGDIFHSSTLTLNSSCANIPKYQSPKLYDDFQNKSLVGCDICGYPGRNGLKHGCEKMLYKTVESKLSDIFKRVSIV